MKSKKSLALAALLALSGAGLASAAPSVTYNVVHVTGSTAFRAAVVTAEVDSLKTATGASSGVYAAYVSSTLNAGTSLLGSNVSIIYGPVVSGVETVYDNNFNGSIGGLFDTVNATNLNYLNPTVYDPNTGSLPAGQVTTTTTGGGVGPSPGTTPSGNYYADGLYVASGSTTPAAPEVTLSDVFSDTASTVIASVGSSLSTTSLTTVKTKVGSTTYQTVGVVPFVFAVGNGTPTGLTNFTPQLANQLWNEGRLPLSFFTGKNSDESSLVYALGRDLDSGTRATALAETGFGAGTPPAQYYPYDNSTDANIGGASGTGTSTGVIGLNAPSGSTIGSVNYVPAETIADNGLSEGAANGGYSSGSNLATALRTQNSLTGAYFITYLGLSDAGNATAPDGFSARIISYNGYSLNVLAGNWDATNKAAYGGGTFNDTGASAAEIEEGQYTFWGYEHMYYKAQTSQLASATLTILAGNLGSELVSAKDDTVASGGANGVTLTAMKVNRGDDGAGVQALYSY